MIETLALRIAERLKRIEPDKTVSVSVMKFSLEVLLNTIITFLLIGFVSLVTGTFGETMIGMGAFMILRFFSGGFHLSKAIHCSLLSTFLISLAPHIPLSNISILIAGGTSLILILIYAPSNIEGHARIPKKYHPILKYISALLVLSNFAYWSSTIAWVFLIQAVTTIQIKRR